MIDLLAILARAEASPSQTPFYILGALAAIYGVAIASIGITQPDFPKDKGQARAVFAASAVIVVLAMAAAVLTS